MAPPDDSELASAPAAMVRVRLFAGLREAMGWSEQLVGAAPDETPLGLWRQLDLGGAWLAATGAPTEAPPAAAALPPGVRVAINQRFAPADTALVDGDELAFLPPISGG